MLSPGKISCDIIVSLLRDHGIAEVVLSPGSRNAPMVTALIESGIKITVIVDERSAAFIALGKALTGKPVGLLCTSGTALLNYGAAVAEAYYRKVPLIVISADRPAEWIDQDDSQTLRQYEALDNYVKRSYNIPANCNDEATQWYVNRIVNEAILIACEGAPGPVHINVQLDEPLNRVETLVPSRWTNRMITAVTPESRLGDDDLQRLSTRLASARVLVIAGFGKYNQALSHSVSQLSRLPNLVVMTENISNLHRDTDVKWIESIDTVLGYMTDSEKESLKPDVVITFGGAIVSRFVKRYLRQCRAEHWHIGLTDNIIDCMKSLAVDIKMPPQAFFCEMARQLSNIEISDSDYSRSWLECYDRAMKCAKEFVASTPWTDLSAMSYIMNHLPQGVNLHLSNGTSIRYSQLFPVDKPDITYQCNRGVSGIDGSTSTAIGDTSLDRITLLVTGDVSMQYDIGALATPNIPTTFKVIVLCNGGGGIFRFIDSTSRHPALEDYFVADRPFPVKQLAEAYGFAFYKADNLDALNQTFTDFIANTDAPAILAIYTDGALNADILRRYLTALR